MATKQMSFRCTDDMHSTTAALATELGMSKAEFIRLAVQRYINDVQSELAAPEVTAPEVTAPEVTAPEVTAPEATAPEVTAPEVTAPEATEDAAMMELLVNSGLLPMSTDNSTINKLTGLQKDIQGHVKALKKYQYGFIEPKTINLPTALHIKYLRESEITLYNALKTLVAMSLPDWAKLEAIETAFMFAPCLGLDMAKDVIKDVRANNHKETLREVSRRLQAKGYALDKLNQIVVALNAEKA